MRDLMRCERGEIDRERGSSSIEERKEGKEKREKREWKRGRRRVLFQANLHTVGKEAIVKDRDRHTYRQENPTNPEQLRR